MLATSAAVSATTFSELAPLDLSPFAGPPATNFFTTSTVAAGPPGSAAKILPDLSITKTPLVVPDGAFLSPISLIRFPETSHSNGYGKFCLVLNVVLDFGESFERPKMESPVAVSGV